MIETEATEPGLAASEEPTPRALASNERDGVLRWLADALRDGKRGRLSAEFPVSLSERTVDAHRVVFSDGKPVAHAMFHVALANARTPIPIGMISLVYTEPSMRGRGLAQHCIEACTVELARRGVPLALLWSDRHDWYARQGFHAAGREYHYRIDAEICRRAGDASKRSDITVGSAADADFAALEELYAAKSARAIRDDGALALLAAAPATEVLVARRDGRPVAYTALGRGDDFEGVVHEWAGDGEAVLACLAAHCAKHGELGWLCGPIDEAPAASLREAGATPHPGCFALMRPLDAASLWRTALRRRATPDEPACADAEPGEDAPLPRVMQDLGTIVLRSSSGAIELTSPELLELLFAPVVPDRVCAHLSPSELQGLGALLPVPLYLWGFDSI